MKRARTMMKLQMSAQIDKKSSNKSKNVFLKVRAKDETE